MSQGLKWQNCEVHIALAMFGPQSKDDDQLLTTRRCTCLPDMVLQYDVNTCSPASTVYVRCVVALVTSEVVQGAADTIEFSLPGNELRRCVHYRLEWTQMSCAHAVENAVTLVNTARDKSVD